MLVMFFVSLGLNLDFYVLLLISWVDFVGLNCD